VRLRRESQCATKRFFHDSEIDKFSSDFDQAATPSTEHDANFLAAADESNEIFRSMAGRILGGDHRQRGIGRAHWIKRAGQVTWEYHLPLQLKHANSIAILTNVSAILDRGCFQG
jgi:hypothetical protein